MRVESGVKITCQQPRQIHSARDVMEMSPKLVSEDGVWATIDAGKEAIIPVTWLGDLHVNELAVVDKRSDNLL